MDDQREDERFPWAERRDGLMTSEVLGMDGQTRRRRDREQFDGHLRRVRRNVFAVGGAPRSWMQEVRAVVLAAGPNVAASNQTALRLLGGDRMESEAIHVIAPLLRQVRMPGVIAHRSGYIAPGDLTARNGIPCTSPVRTVVDLSGALHDESLGRAGDDLIRRRLLDLDALRLRVSQLRPAPGRSVARLRRVLAARIPGYDPGESELEGRIRRIIDRAGLPVPSHQLRVEFGGVRYRIDFAWPERHVFLEGNGFGFHSMATALDRDARRQNEMVLVGWRPLEVTWRMSDAEIESILRRALL